MLYKRNIFKNQGIKQKLPALIKLTPGQRFIKSFIMPYIKKIVKVFFLIFTKIFILKFSKKSTAIFAKALATVLMLAVAIGPLCSCRDLDDSSKNPYVTPKIFTITYQESEGGWIQGDLIQQVEQGGDGNWVAAYPNIEYSFLRWSDGETNSLRREENVQISHTITALFAKKTYNVLYSTDGNGYILGEYPKTVFYGEDVPKITAIPNEGYVFSHWSDGYKHVGLGGDFNGTSHALDDGFEGIDDGFEGMRQDFYVTSDIDAVAIFTKEEFSVTYSTDGNGYILGENPQKILYGEDSAKVKAIPNDGYEFSHWSDEFTLSAERVDAEIKGDKSVVAFFKRLEREFEYVYNGATGGCDAERVIITYENFSQVILSIPTREGYQFVGWFLDNGFNVQVANGAGVLIIGHELFNYSSSCLYARWIISA